MKLNKKFGFVCIYFCILFLVITPASHANSAEPPRLIVIVDFPPDDLVLSLRFQDGSSQESVQLYKTQTAWEAQYKFTYGMVAASRPSLENVTLIAASGNNTFEYLLPASMLSSYDNIISLDFDTQTVTNGQTFSRSALLVLMRVILTLMMEGFILFAFGYRKKQSWIAFLIINLITQGALNIALNLSFAGTYLIFALAFYELLILIIEIIAFTAIIKEHTKRRTVGFVLLANLFSLILGGALISYLPV